MLSSLKAIVSQKKIEELNNETPDLKKIDIFLDSKNKPAALHFALAALDYDSPCIFLLVCIDQFKKNPTTKAFQLIVEIFLTHEDSSLFVNIAESTIKEAKARVDFLERVNTAAHTRRGAIIGAAPGTKSSFGPVQTRVENLFNVFSDVRSAAKAMLPNENTIDRGFILDKIIAKFTTKVSDKYYLKEKMEYKNSSIKSIKEIVGRVDENHRIILLLDSSFQKIKDYKL